MQIKIVSSLKIVPFQNTGVEVIKFHNLLNLGIASALVLSKEDAFNDSVIKCVSTWRTPLFLIDICAHELNNTPLAQYESCILSTPLSETTLTQILNAAGQFELKALPPFTATVSQFTSMKRPTFACPGHQGGHYLDLHPAGLRFKEMLGENIFNVDIPHAAPELGDVLSHQGPIRQAENLAAEVFNSDETYFVLNGTSTANQIVASALLSAGDIVLMDRNNHKSVYLGALVQCGARAVFLDNHRDELGVLGGYRKGALSEDMLRTRVSRIDGTKAKQERPFRLAIVQHATCDGVVVNAMALLQRIGHLCDYVLFDSAWLGYEPFVDQLSHLSPLIGDLPANAPGIVVTQSVHKQMAGFSQTSQIHKKDQHIKNQSRYCSRHLFESAFMLHASTSPFYPLFMSLEVNAALHANGHGRELWNSAVSIANKFRKTIDRSCKLIKVYSGGESQIPYVLRSPSTGDSRPAEFKPFNEKSCPIEADLHFMDPCKIILTTNACREAKKTGYLSIPASIVAQYLREMNFTPEKCDFYNFTLLISPSTKNAHLDRLAHTLTVLELHILNDTNVIHLFPSLARSGSRYSNLSLRQLCTSINDLFIDSKIQQLQSSLFSLDTSTPPSFSPYEANQAFIRGQTRLVPLAAAQGCVSAEGVIPYPPGVMCIAPGERWNAALIDYLLVIQQLIDRYPEFAPHIQGLHYTQGDNGEASILVNVLDNALN
ncbi:ornithine decarboxylase [Pseudomonas putida]|uniref:Orn/Lys/Arg family decarboxylase n=1 Tax=Pseudomonas putida TaxID=303 RepID=UPI002363F70B|nr:ornithine decarboxylase [Pseudomonas putida]MDD1968036.1 ornithine decarboxylase [Pseudomonas putida]